MIKFSKRMDPEVKKKYDKYGELFRRSFLRDLTEVNKDRDIGQRITYENKIQINSLLKQIANYLVSYYIKASEYDSTDLCMMFDGVWRFYSEELENKLKIKNKTKKDKTNIVVDYLCLYMCRSCLGFKESIVDILLYEQNEKSVDTLIRVIDAVGYNTFIIEFYIQKVIYFENFYIVLYRNYIRNLLDLIKINYHKKI